MPKKQEFLQIFDIDQSIPLIYKELNKINNNQR